MFNRQLCQAFFQQQWDTMNRGPLSTSCNGEKKGSVVFNSVLLFPTSQLCSERSTEETCREGALLFYLYSPEAQKLHKHSLYQRWREKYSGSSQVSSRLPALYSLGPRALCVWSCRSLGRVARCELWVWLLRGEDTWTSKRGRREEEEGRGGKKKSSNPGCLEREDRQLIRGLSIRGVLYAQSGLWGLVLKPEMQGGWGIEGGEAMGLQGEGASLWGREGGKKRD